MKKLVLALLVIAVSQAFSGRAYALTATGTLDVSANVVAACTVTATGVVFPDTDGTVAASGNGDVTVNCSNGTAYNIALDAGLNLFSIYRSVSDDAGNYLLYTLYQGPSMGTEWGDSDYDNTFPWGASLADTGDGTDQPHTMLGILHYTYDPPGAYTDVVNVTVYY